MLDCKKTTCKHYKSLNYRHDFPVQAAIHQIPPEACATCCHFYPSHFEEPGDDLPWYDRPGEAVVDTQQEPNIAPALEEINDP